LKVFENVGAKFDFATTPNGEVFLLPALPTFILLAAILLLVAMTGKRSEVGPAEEDVVEGS
jgi:hypothetical protein